MIYIFTFSLCFHLYISNLSSFISSILPFFTFIVILFDWDDTLCPSSHLSTKGFTLETLVTCRDTESGLRALEASVINLLELAFTYGEVHIVTNAETGWVQLSASKFIPGVLPLLDRTKIISARSTYERLFPDEPYKWKVSNHIIFIPISCSQVDSHL